MTSFKRFLQIILVIAVLSCIFLIYSINNNQPANVQNLSHFEQDWEFIETTQIMDGEKPKVWIFGDSEDNHCGKIYSNVLQLCMDLHLNVLKPERLDVDQMSAQDLVIFCDSFISSYADFEELEEFIAGGGRIILAAGLSEGGEESRLWKIFGIRQKSAEEDYHDLIFEKPLLPVQPEYACYYDGNSKSARLRVDSDATVYIREQENDIPILYTYDWHKGSICLINGIFLTDSSYMGLLTGAIGILLPDFIYPVLGVKTVFLDNLPMLSYVDDERCRRLYGYSAEGFFRDVLWPAFQGVSLRTNTLYTSSILSEASSENCFTGTNDAVFTTICKSVLKFGGEIVYAVNCLEDGKVVFNDAFIERFSKVFSNYTVNGLVMETDTFSPEMLEVSGANIRFVRGMLGSSDTRLSWEKGRTVFPAATMGNYMEDGNIFAIYSVLGAYGMISHVFDVSQLITSDGKTAAWDLDKLQISLFESEVLNRAQWLESRTLSQTENDVRSYQNMDYNWTRRGNRIVLNCSGAAKGQAFFYHTDDRILETEGMSYQDVGNGYYLLRIQEKQGIIMLEKGE